jgi:hypothetical protein
MTRLEEAVLDLERHAAVTGWDLPPRLYALVETDELRRDEPDLAQRLGAATGTFTALEQEPISADRAIEELLTGIVWPETVHGCALVIERILLPDDAAEDLPDEDPQEWVAGHPGRQDVRIVVGVLRDGSRYSALRMRAHDADDEVLRAADLVPALSQALATSLAP